MEWWGRGVGGLNERNEINMVGPILNSPRTDKDGGEGGIILSHSYGTIFLLGLIIPSSKIAPKTGLRLK